jgi:hypothetical protein
MFTKENLPTYQDFVKCENIFENRLEQLAYAFNINHSDLIMEVGVHHGESLTYLCNIDKNKKVFGFDSFEGLPNNWDLGNKVVGVDVFNLEGVLPVVPDNAVLVKGWFSQSIPEFFQTYKNDKISILHIDCDIYQSAVDVLTSCNDYFQPGSIIIFDELAHWKKIKKYKNYNQHEFRALVEWIIQYDRKIEIISRTSSFQAAIKILE